MQSGQRLLVWLALVLCLAVLMYAGARFLWPSAARGSELLAGNVDGFAPGSVTAFVAADGRWLSRVPAAAMPDTRSGLHVAGEVVYVVRLESGEFRALLSKSPHRGCTVLWDADFETWIGGERVKGAFRDPCSGSLFDITGRRVFGPSPRDLDRFPVAVRDGLVIVDTGILIEGESIAKHQVPVTPERTATPPAGR